MNPIPFNKAWLPPVLASHLKSWACDGLAVFEKDHIQLCSELLSSMLDHRPVLLTGSSTQALEMAALLLGIQAGDEVIMPSYTFVSSANPFVLRGGIPVFVDIRPDTLNMDEALIEKAVTEKTRAIVAVHYAGVAADMERISAIADRHGLYVIEDAAHGISATYRDKPLGTMSEMGSISFDTGKNVQCFKGGALIINKSRWLERARLILEKGTNRFDFDQGKADQYTWMDTGSNFTMNSLNSIYLYYQLLQASEINQHRLVLWDRYQSNLLDLSGEGRFDIPHIPEGCRHNAHIFYLICNDRQTRDRLIRYLADHGITAVFHYIPLHSSPAGLKFGRFHGEDRHTTRISECIARLPLFHELKEEDVDLVCEKVKSFFRSL